MATIYLKHPVHGSKVAIDQTEAANDAAAGWIRYDPATPVSAAVENAPTPEVLDNLLVKRRPGRPRKEV